jgi:hypothetical protein
LRERGEKATLQNKHHSKKKTVKKMRARAKRLAAATAAYYASLAGNALAHENRLELAVAHGSMQVDFEAD